MRHCNSLQTWDLPLQTMGITDLLMEPAKLKDQFPDISGTRNLNDNLSDLKAQVAANNKGIGLVSDLIAEYSLPVVQAYMGFIQVGVSLNTANINNSSRCTFLECQTPPLRSVQSHNLAGLMLPEVSG